MREAYGGIFSLTLLATFLVIISSIIAFAISYSKALRMKEFAITQFEKQECQINADLRKSIEAEASRIGYSSNISKCGKFGGENINGICVYRTINPTKEDSYSKATGHITTYAGINLPFLKDIFPSLQFEVKGTSNECRYLNN